jgi:glycerol kinase
MSYVLGIDQGTTGTTVLLLDRKGKVAGRGYREIRQLFPKPAWVEHDPEDIWQSVMDATVEALAAAGATTRDVRAVGITNQRGRPLHHAIVWQCRRTAPRCDELRAKGLEDDVRARTGLTLDAYFSGTKVKWLLDHAPDVREAAKAGRAAFGTIDSWVLYRLTGGKVHATDPTNASRTLLYDVRKLAWSPELGEMLGIPATLRLPEVAARSGAPIRRRSSGSTHRSRASSGTSRRPSTGRAAGSPAWPR